MLDDAIQSKGCAVLSGLVAPLVWVAELRGLTWHDIIAPSIYRPVILLSLLASDHRASPPTTSSPLHPYNLQVLRTMSIPLTTHLVSLSTPRPYSAATKHTFLTTAGTGALSLPLLSLYLSQDRIYAAHAYPRFLGHLLASVPFSSQHAPDSREECFHSEVVGVLSDALANVRHEVRLFGEVEQKYGLPSFADWKERKATRDYTAEMAHVGAMGSFEEGLVFLWAMERVSCCLLYAH